MAALPAIELGGVQALQGVDPSVVRAEGRAFADLARTGADVANTIQKVITDDQVTDTTVATSREMSDWVTDNKSKQYFTAAEAKALGVSDAALTDSAGNDRQEIPAHEVYPEALSLKMGELIEQQSGGISAPGARNTWTARMEGMRDDMYTKSVLEAEQTRHKHRIDKTNFDIEEALDAGDFGIAYILAEEHPIVEEREKLKEAIILKEEESGYYGVIRSENPWNMEHEADFLRSEEYEGTMNDPQRHAWIKRLEQEAKGIRAAQESGVNRAIMREIAEVELGVEKGLVGQEKIEEMYQKYPEHFTADTWKRLTRKADEKNQELIDDFNGMSRVGMALDGLGYVDPHGNTDDKKYVDMVYDMSVDELLQSGNPDAYRLASELGTRTARTTGYIPEGMQAQFRAAYNMELPPEQLAVLAGSFVEIQQSAPGALDFMADKEKIMMQQIAALNRAGTPTPEAVESLRVKIDNQPSDVLSRRTSEFIEEGKGGGHGDSLDKLIRNNWDMSGIGGYIPFVGGPQASTQMQLDFENKARHYYQLTGDLDASRESAFADLSAIYGVSEINGDKELVRDAIEIRYPNIPPDVIQQDAKLYMKASGIPKDMVDNVRIVPDTSTATALENPSYSLVHMDPDDIGSFSLVTNSETGAPIRYRPDAQRINDRRVKKEVTDAKNRRELKRLRQPENREEYDALRRKREEVSKASLENMRDAKRNEKSSKQASKERGQIQHVQSRRQEADRDTQSLQSLGLIQ